MSEEVTSVEVSSWLPEGDKSCANCLNYSWPQPSQESQLLRCSKCKFMSYCSKECQVEHWVKVHKEQCKYLAEKKVLPQAIHDPASCPGCLKQTEIGLREMAKVDNPWFGCPFESYFVPKVFVPNFVEGGIISSPIPFTLGEMSGKFLTKTEHTISILMHLLHKMKLVKHAAWIFLPEICDDIYTHLRSLRQFTWDIYLFANPGHEREQAIDEKFLTPPLLLPELHDLADKIDNKLAELHLKDHGVFRPWDTFKLLLNFLFLLNSELMRKDAESAGVPETSEVVKKMKVTSAQFIDIWRKVLASLAYKLVPFTDLLKIFCGGQLKQKCFGCSKRIKVNEMLIFSSSSLYSKQAPYHFHSHFSANLCGNPNCYKKVSVHDFSLIKTYMKTGMMSSGQKCDSCALPGVKVHRCTGCLTKLYCGELCRDEDWDKVHKQVCRKGEVRKVKSGKQERVKEGVTTVDEVVKAIFNMQSDQWRSFESMWGSLDD